MNCWLANEHDIVFWRGNWIVLRVFAVISFHGLSWGNSKWVSRPIHIRNVCCSSIALDLFHHYSRYCFGKYSKSWRPKTSKLNPLWHLLRACTNGLCIHNPNDEYVPHQTLGYTAGSLPLSWNRSTYRVEMAIQRETSCMLGHYWG